MKLISHRGNLNGKITQLENSIDYINKALDKGFDVEIDVWLINDELFLGHDTPDYKIDVSFLKNDKLWCHAKNREALELMLTYDDIRCFWHQEDDYCITSDKIIWQYPSKNQKINNSGVFLMPELYNYSKEQLKGAYGICSDYVEDYK